MGLQKTVAHPPQQESCSQLPVHCKEQQLFVKLGAVRVGSWVTEKHVSVIHCSSFKSLKCLIRLRWGEKWKRNLGVPALSSAVKKLHISTLSWVFLSPLIRRTVLRWLPMWLGPHHHSDRLWIEDRRGDCLAAKMPTGRNPFWFT